MSTPEDDRLRSTIGILFVHGMGEQARGDTLTQMGDALSEWLRKWLTSQPDGDFTLRSATLRSTEDDVTSGPGKPSLGGQAHVEAEVINTKTGEVQRWLLAESWWADVFRPASFSELVTWALSAGPWLIASQRAGIDRRIAAALSARSGVGRLGTQLMGVLLTLIAAIAAAIVAPLAIGLLVLSVLPVPVLSDLTRRIALNLSGSFGDLLVLVRSPVRFAAMAERVRIDMARVGMMCEHLMVVAHSQGSAVAWHAIRRAAEQPGATRPKVDLFLSFGQAFRKLKSLYRLSHSSGLVQATFMIWAVDSTIALVAAGTQAIQIANALVATRVNIGESLSLAGPSMVLFAALIAIVLLTQGILYRMASENNRATEREIESEITAVRASFSQFAWVDLWASADPAPNGPLLAEPTTGVESYRVRNMASTLFDHSVYWSNTTEFVSAVAFSASSIVPPSAIGESSRIPPVLAEAARVRDLRVALLAAARVVAFSGFLALLYILRHDLPTIGHNILLTLEEVPLLPDWFGGWRPTARGFVAAGVLSLAGLLVWWALVWAWTKAVALDEGPFFRRTGGAVATGAAVSWSVLAGLVPLIIVVFLAALYQDIGGLILFLGGSVIGIPAVWFVLTVDDRRFGQEPMPAIARRSESKSDLSGSRDGVS